MKKIYLFTLLTFATLISQAQVEFGFQFSPTLSTTRVQANTEAFDFDNYKSGIRFNTGIVTDFFLKDNVAFSTGLFYSVKRTGVSSTDTIAGAKTTNSMTNTQYLNLPIGLKLYTQEWIPNMRFFINVGGLADFKVSKDKVQLDGKEVVNPKTYSKFFDSSIQIGLGTDVKVGNNKVFGQIYYNRGLISMLTKEYSTTLNSKNLRVNSDQYGLMLGYKF
jgi:hypothetical protein